MKNEPKYYVFDWTKSMPMYLLLPEGREPYEADYAYRLWSKNNSWMKPALKFFEECFEVKKNSKVKKVKTWERIQYSANPRSSLKAREIQQEFRHKTGHIIVEPDRIIVTMSSEVSAGSGWEWIRGFVFNCGAKKANTFFVLATLTDDVKSSGPL